MTIALIVEVLPVIAIFALFGFLAGFVPIPVGYSRGKIKWLTWCGTGMHAHICYWHSDGSGLQSIHPDDVYDGDSE